VFKIGDRIVETTGNGDRGTIAAPYDDYLGLYATEKCWWVDWDDGGRYFIREQAMRIQGPDRPFKPGDRVVETKTGDTGTVTGIHTASTMWVKWDSIQEDNDGDARRWIKDEAIELLDESDRERKQVEDAIAFLQARGYTVTGDYVCP